MSWIAAYLTNRQQRVIFNATTTKWRDVEAGVIQGYSIGPILFIIFIADINQYLPEYICLEKYADDILAYVIRNIDTLPQEIADGVNKCCKENHMRLNITKCKVIHIGDKLKATVKIDGKPPRYSGAI